MIGASRIFVRVLVAFCASAARAQSPDDRLPGPNQYVSTFSIIAFDPETGQLGVGVQSRAFAAGATVPWAKDGVDFKQLVAK